MEEQQPKRGCFLTGILWVCIVFSTLSLIYNILARFIVKAMDPYGLIRNMSLAFFSYTIGATLLALIGYILVLCWKKQGCYLLLIINVIGFIISFLAPRIDISMIISTVVGFVIELLIIYFCYKAIDKREKFVKEEI